MRVLLTNDDGLDAPGLLALARTMRKAADTFAVVPEHERSAASHAITLHKPLRAVRAKLGDTGLPAWATNGTPADCIVLGVLDLLGTPPDVVVAGINRGANLGMDLVYSGTVSGAVEATLFGISAIAISVASFTEIHWHPAAAFAAHLAREVNRNGLPKDTFLNVNVPNLPASKIRGVEITRQSTRRYVSRLEKRADPRGRDYYWLTGSPTGGEDPGTDVRAVAEGRISVTPLRLDMTHDELTPMLRSWNLKVPKR